MVKIKCDDINCQKLLLDLESTQHNLLSHILLRLFSYYIIGCPICHIQILGEVKAKLTELKIFEGRLIQ